MPHRPVQPALIIGVGGSGIDIARRFKRRFQTLHPDTPYVRLLGIDTAPQTASSPAAPQLADGEFIQAAQFNMNFFVGPGHINQHPSIREWWKGYDGLSLRMVQQGAGQRRPVGRLALFVRYNDVVDRLRQHLQGVFNDRHFQELPSHYRRAINIYIVASTCGGTGTGMFLDLAYVARQVVADTIPGVAPWVRALLLMPSVFIGTNTVAGAQNHANLRANAYGALAELDFSMSAGARLEPIEYPDRRRIERGEAPFRSCYLVGNQTSAGALLTNIEEIFEKAAVHLMIELASPLSNTGESVLDNILERIAATRDSQGRPRLYSSFSGDWLELPSGQVLLRWTKRYAQRLLNRLGGSTGSTGAAAALQQLALSEAYGSLKSLIAGNALSKFEPRVDGARDAFMDVPDDGADPNVLIQNARALHGDAMRQIRANEALGTVVEGAVGGVYPEIEEQLRDLLVSSSLTEARQFLVNIEAEMQNWLARARERSGAADDQWVREFSTQINGMSKGLLQSRRAFAQQQRELVIDAAESGRRAWMEQLKHRVFVEVDGQLPATVARVRALRERVEQASGMVNAAAVEIEHIPEPRIATGMTVQAIRGEDIDAAFDEPARLEALDLAARDSVREILTNGRLAPADFTQRIFHVAQQAVRTVAPEYLKRLMIPTEEIARRVNRMSALVVFTAKWSALPDSQIVDDLTLVGLPESMSAQADAVRNQIEAESRSEVQISTHQDEERVIMTAQKHGFPLYSLAEIQECQREFQQSDARTRALRFVLPGGAVRSWDILPVDSEDSLKYFALALALGKIRRAGTRYLYNNGPGRTPDPALDVALGEDADPSTARQKARDEFLKGGYATEVKTLLDARVQTEGNKPVFDELGQWVQEQEGLSNDPVYPRNFLREVELVKEFRTSIPPY